MFKQDNFDIDNVFANLPDDMFLNDDKTGQCSPVPSTSKSISPVRKHPHTNDTARNVCQKKVAVKRKFPGPAGLFPETNGTLNVHSNAQDQIPFILSSQFPSSQNPNLKFQEVTWQDMCKDFKCSNLIEKYDIKWINDNISLNLVNKKVPFLAAIVKKVKNTSKSPIFVLADPAGEIEALISSDLYEDYNEYLISDSVLILKQFSILSVSANKHYVNITTDNLVRIYSSKESEDYVNVVHMQEISITDLEKDVIDFVNKYERIQDNSKGISNLHILNKMCRYNIKPVSANNIGYSFNTNVRNNILNDRSNMGIAAKEIKTGSDDTAKKFNFKNVLNEINAKSKNILPTSLNRAKNIFETANNSSDIFDLNIDDFQDDFSVPEVNQENVPNLNNESKKRRRECFDASRSDANQVGKSDKIDCSQISIISQNNSENSDIIKEVFSDLDASALFDDF